MQTLRILLAASVVFPGGCAASSPDEQFASEACDLLEDYRQQSQRERGGGEASEVSLFDVGDGLAQLTAEAEADDVNMPRAQRFTRERCGESLEYYQQDSEEFMSIFDGNGGTSGPAPKVTPP